MKHLLTILTLLSFVSVASAEEQVYYCAMEQDTFLINLDGKKMTGYKDRFTASIDFDNETLISKDLWLLDVSGSDCKYFKDYTELLCNFVGGVGSISIRSDSLTYVLSWHSISTFEKGGDPIGVSYGKCEVF